MPIVCHERPAGGGELGRRGLTIAPASACVEIQLPADPDNELPELVVVINTGAVAVYRRQHDQLVANWDLAKAAAEAVDEDRAMVAADEAAEDWIHNEDLPVPRIHRVAFEAG